jgi:hypothetical protein
MTALSALHATKNKAPIDEDVFRDICERVTGQRSTKAMSEKQRWMVVDELKRLYPSIKQTSKPRPDGRKKLTGAYAKKLQALWIAAWNLGIVNNRDDAALLAFVKRQTGIDHTRFLRYPVDANKAIEALKAWMAREAGVEWTILERKNDHPVTRLSGYRIAEAQWCRLHNCKHWMSAQSEPFRQHIMAIAKAEWFNLGEEADWVPVMNDLGKRIREKKAAA